jgi:flagellar biogenesis protein FliO
MGREETADLKVKNRRNGLLGSIAIRIGAALQNSLGGGRAGRRMELIETLQLGGKRQLLLVSCDGQRYLVGAGGDNIHSIAELVHGHPARSALPEQEEDFVQRRSPVAMKSASQEMRCY